MEITRALAHHDYRKSVSGVLREHLTRHRALHLLTEYDPVHLVSLAGAQSLNLRGQLIGHEERVRSRLDGCRRRRAVLGDSCCRRLLFLKQAVEDKTKVVKLVVDKWRVDKVFGSGKVWAGETMFIHASVVQVVGAWAQVVSDA